MSEKIILASASPRRKELMALIAEDFEVIPSNAEENVPEDIPAAEAARYLACMKAEFVAAKNPGKAVIGCDTVVILDGKVMGKPSDPYDADAMLHALSGKTHKVVTGVCLDYYFPDGGKMTDSFSQETLVEFYELSDDEISEYVRSGEPMDKAGAYGIQGMGGLMVKKINGDYNNVVGLPAAMLKRRLDGFMVRVNKMNSL